MLVIKCAAMKEMPEDCERCVWFECRPHPHKGWSAACGLMLHSLDDDQPEEWIYGGDGRVDACPLMEVPDTRQEIIHCNECEYGELDENEEWFCRSVGCQIGSKDGSGYCADGERRVNR